MRSGNHFFGTVTVARSFGHLRVSESSYTGLTCLARHGHPSAYLSFVVAGSYAETIRGREIHCGPSVLRYHPAGEEHANLFGARGGTCLNVELPPDLDAGDLSSRPVAMDSAAWPALRIRRELQRQDNVSTLVVEEMVVDLLGRCRTEAQRREGAVGSMPVRRATAFIDTHLADPLTLRMIADAAGVHETHLARLFRQRLTMTAGEYVRRRRIARAEHRLLAEPTAPASTIAISLGFADLAHFSRTFRRVVGVTPTEFRRICKS